MRDYFGASEEDIQRTISINFLGFCLSALIYGPLSESLGRRKVLLFGQTIFTLGAIACVLAQSIEMFLIARFAQGLGASAAATVGFTMFADAYKGDVAAKHMGRINAILTALIAVAPVIGGIIHKSLGWRWNLIFLAICGVVSLIPLFPALPETLIKKRPLVLNQIFGDYFILLKSKVFLLYAIVPNFLAAAYLTFVGSSPFFYMDTCHISPLAFAWHQGLVVAAFSLTSFYSSALLKYLGSRNCKLWGVLLSLFASFLLIFTSSIFPYNPYFITILMFLYAAGAGSTFSIFFAESLELHPDQKGAATSLIMSSRLFFSSILISVSGFFYDGKFVVASIIIFFSVLISAAATLRILMEKKTLEIS
jgi:DHA1 family bicyclomycin/chloramphenicol resistance-like MFS transporter